MHKVYTLTIHTRHSICTQYKYLQHTHYIHTSVLRTNYNTLYKQAKDTLAMKAKYTQSPIIKCTHTTDPSHNTNAIQSFSIDTYTHTQTQHTYFILPRKYTNAC